MLPDLASGVRQSAFALTEPGAGSDVARLATRYVRTADGFALTGEGARQKLELQKELPPILP